MPRIDLIELRRGTDADWLSVNPVLASGEPGWNETTFELRIGDGVTPWASLPTVAGGSGSGDPAGAAAAALASAEAYADGLVDDLSGVSNPVAARAALGGGNRYRVRRLARRHH